MVVHQDSELGNSLSSCSAFLIDNQVDWLEAIVIVGFDLELGQTIEDVYSINGTLDDVDKSKIRSLSLPDNNNGLDGDVQYIFRYHNDSVPKESLEFHNSTFKYCSSFFRQVEVRFFASLDFAKTGIN